MNANEVQILGPIASGGMGSVSLALRTTGGAMKPVAVKRLHAHLSDDPDSVAAFLDEARIASRIDHPNVARIFDVDMLADELVIVMDYVEGAPLSHLLRAARAADATLPVGVTCRILFDALTGLHAAHEAENDRGERLDLVHRDVSPPNLLVGSDGVTRVTDFGIAVAAGRLAMTKDEQMVKGKLHYLSPEQIYRGGVDRRTDVFAAGIVLWETLTGRKLFSAGTEGETLAMILREPIPLASSIRSDVPFELDEICMKALERDAARRYATADEFADALRPFASPPSEVASVVERYASELLLQRRQLLAAGRGPASSRRSSLQPSSHEVGSDADVGTPFARRLRHGAVAIALVVGGLAGACGMKLSSTSAPSTAALAEPLTPAPREPSPTAMTAPAAPLASVASVAPVSAPDDLEIIESPAGNAEPSRPAPRTPAATKARPAARSGARRGNKPFMPTDL